MGQLRGNLHEERRAGLDHLAAIVDLLIRARAAHPTAGAYDAGEVEWWWAHERSTDDTPQLYWFDDDGPVAAAFLTDWEEYVALDPIVLPDAPADREIEVMARGLEYAASLGHDEVVLEVGRDNETLRAFLSDRGFAVREPGLTESWLDAGRRPSASAAPDGYRLTTRRDAPNDPYHYVKRNGARAEMRLGQTPHYRPELDLSIVADDGTHAAHGLFWWHPETSSGVVEPMLTEPEHRRRGLARVILTTGLERLAELGAERIKICFEPDNVAASRLYLDVGFQPVRSNDFFGGPTS